MNKQELIKYYEDMSEKLHVFPIVAISRVLEDLRQLDEPQKLVVPQFVADWYEENKDDFEGNLFRFINRLPAMYQDGEFSEFEKWVIEAHTKPFQILVNMHQFGYTVEEEKRYLVTMKGKIEENVLTYGNNIFRYFFTRESTSEAVRIYHTRKELKESGFGWVFDCPGIKIEEVE